MQSRLDRKFLANDTQAQRNLFILFPHCEAARTHLTENEIHIPVSFILISRIIKFDIWRFFGEQNLGELTDADCRSPSTSYRTTLFNGNSLMWVVIAFRIPGVQVDPPPTSTTLFFFTAHYSFFCFLFFRATYFVDIIIDNVPDFRDAPTIDYVHGLIVRSDDSIRIGLFDQGFIDQVFVFDFDP